MKEVCAWCAKVLRDGPDDKVTHGICAECERRYFPKPIDSPSPSER